MSNGIVHKNTILNYLGFPTETKINWNLSPAELTRRAAKYEDAKLCDLGALVVNTGKFTGRSPKDRFIVKDEITKDHVWWGDVNIPFDSAKFNKLKAKLVNYLGTKEIYARDAFACADPTYKLNIRVVTELAWSNLFAHNIFLRPEKEELANFQPEWHILCAPGFKANPSEDGTVSENFAVLNFTEKTILIGGTAYTGEIKKSIFSVLNFVLPHDKSVLSMHCSANIGENNDTSIFFGLSGTGKTTLSADPDRKLIGDDEHGWSDKGVFNFEGGCYAKTINLSEEFEPQIFHAIRFGSLLENVGFEANSTKVNFEDNSITPNTRVSYPTSYIDNAVKPSIGGVPKNIFFLTCDAYGVLPPISKLNPGQAMYYFISGYTAKVAGTEIGITEPKMVFSACFGEPFMPLHPTKYAEMLGKKIEETKVKVWLINTGWSGGGYGVGSRIKLKYTRAMISAALNGGFDKVDFHKQEVFGLEIPSSCEGIDENILNPKDTWEDKQYYDKQASKLASAFVKNFEKFSEYANAEIMAAAPKVSVNV